MAGLTTFTLARFQPSRVPSLLATVPLERLRLRRQPGLAWGRHLGTGAGDRTRGADPSRWAWLCTWDDDDEAARFASELTARLVPEEAATLFLRPVRARGSWGGHGLAATEALDPARAAGPSGGDGGALVVLTRARVRVRRWRRFTGAVPPVDADLVRAEGLLRSLGVGEWPVLVQGTLSVWKDAQAMTAFTRTDAHRRAVRRTADEDWYAEELFARFCVERAEGTWDGAPPLEPSGR